VPRQAIKQILYKKKNLLSPDSNLYLFSIYICRNPQNARREKGAGFLPDDCDTAGRSYHYAAAFAKDGVCRRHLSHGGVRYH